MNRGVMQSSPVQQITAAGNPNWWNISTMSMVPPSHHLPAPFAAAPLPSTNFVTQPFTPLPCWPLDTGDYSSHNAALQSQPPAPADHSWTHLFMGGLASEEAAMAGVMNQFPEKQHHHNNSSSSSGFVFGNSTSATPTTTTTTSPQSCITTFSSTSLLELSPTTTTTLMSDPAPPPPNMVDPTRECNGGSVKKAKVQGTATQASFKVRKFGDRITSLHQLVSPFGKTDTASVLLEAIGYIRFLQSQVEALSHPYLNSGSGNNKRQQLQQPPHSLLNDNCLKRKGGPDQDVEEPRKDLRSRGLCLVPASMTSDVGRDNGADYWAPMLGGFR